jgi:hypothetical protein
MEDRATPVVCEACGGDEARKLTCMWCERTGMLTAERFALYRASREQRITGQFQAWRAIVGDTVDILEARNTKFTRAMAAEGRKLLLRYDRAFEAGGGVSQSDRSKAVVELRLYQDRVVSYLANKPGDP